MVCGPQQDSLLLEEDAFLPVREDLLAHRRYLSILVGASDETRARPGLRGGGAQYRGEPFGSFGGHTVRHVENLLSRPVIGVEDDGPCSGKGLFEIQDVTRFGCTERIDRLGV